MIANLLIVVNSSFKFFIYLVFSQNFREDFCEKFLKITPEEENLQDPVLAGLLDSEDKKRQVLEHVKVAAFVQAET